MLNVEENFTQWSMASPMNAMNLLAYCSGSAVEIPSTLDPVHCLLPSHQNCLKLDII